MIVVDSSVAVKWYVAEPDSGRARTLIGRPLLAPDLIRAEVANALWKKVRRGEATAAQARGALPHLARSVILLPSEPFSEMALDLSLDLGHSVYDYFFLEMARTLDFPLLTSDEKLWTRTRGSSFADGVILLRDWDQEHD
ncbi:MAG TPA: type II toxin-antitoxin system VapC family toxin [Allosphingosinicella sp.]|nr:type II toxin-antitoxin system VapC family toxin [Allosphingosinicella sp.]